MARQHILLAENRPNLQHSLGLVLKQAHYRVTLVGTMEEAVTLASTLGNTAEGVDLLIVDLDSASMEACSAFMQSLSASPLAIPYLVLAEEIRGQTIEALKKHGCLACIAKPFEPATLLRSVHDALGPPKQHEEDRPGKRPEENRTERPVNQPG